MLRVFHTKPERTRGKKNMERKKLKKRKKWWCQKKKTEVKRYSGEGCGEVNWGRDGGELE